MKAVALLQVDSMSNINQKSLKYHKAFKEVYILINDFSSELYIKIPKSFIKILKENMDKTYDVSLEKLHSEGTMEETDAVMSLVFNIRTNSSKLSVKMLYPLSLRLIYLLATDFGKSA